MLFCETGAPGAAGLRFASVGAGRVPPARSTVLRAHRKKSRRSPRSLCSGDACGFLIYCEKTYPHSNSKDSFTLNQCFSSDFFDDEEAILPIINTTIMIRMIAVKIPAIPCPMIFSVAKKVSIVVIVFKPPLNQRKLVTIWITRPPAITEAICPDTFAPAACIRIILPFSSSLASF